MDNITANITEEVISVDLVSEEINIDFGCLPVSGYYLGAYSTDNQTCASATTAYPIHYNEVYTQKGINLVDNSKIVFTASGIYNLAFSIQYTNKASNAIYDADVWARVNGVNAPFTNSQTSIPAKHGGVNGHAITAVNFIGPFNAGDYVELMWSSNGDGNVLIETIGTQTNPVRPAAPGIILTVWRILP